MNIATLRNEESTAAALKMLAATDTPNRTQYFELDNNTSQFDLTLVLCEGYDEQFQPPANYQKDTGLTVTGTNVGPGTKQQGIIQPTINVWVTHAKCSLHWKRTIAPYDEGDLTLKDYYSNKGEFFLSVSVCSSPLAESTLV